MGPTHRPPLIEKKTKKYEFCILWVIWHFFLETSEVSAQPFQNFNFSGHPTIHIEIVRNLPVGWNLSRKTQIAPKNKKLLILCENDKKFSNSPF